VSDTLFIIWIISIFDEHFLCSKEFINLNLDLLKNNYKLNDEVNFKKGK